MSEVTIANSALAKIGEFSDGGRITSFTEGTRNANIAAERYPELRDALLRDHTWTFAKRRRKLAQSTRTPVFKWEHQYPLPADFLRLVNVSNNDVGTGHLRYQLESDEIDGRVIMTNAEEVWLAYIAKITDTSQMPPDFREALAFKLASEFAISIAQSTGLAQNMDQLARDAVWRAKATGGIEDFPQERPEGSWINARRGGGW